MAQLMPYLLDWANLLTRWLHLITGIAWIGASFYFVMLDNSLKRPRKTEDEARGVHGELWAVHGGGFYCSQKFLTGPKGEPLSDDLHWSKWEAYTTWLSGMGMLALVYWLGAAGTLTDAKVLDLTQGVAVALSIAFLGAGWVIYDLLCRALEGRDGLLGIVVAILVLAADWLAFNLFAPRAAYIHVGAMLGTCMVANVFFHIMPGQRRMVNAIRTGQPVDPRPGQIGKQRSVHNTYFTLPVLFVMISNHYPMTFGNAHGGIVLAGVMLAGVLIRQFFVRRHAHGPAWALPATAVAILVGLIVWMAPKPVVADKAVDIGTAQRIVAERCASCHAEKPTREGFAQPPKGIVLETPAQIASNASMILNTVSSGYMPLGNLTGMTDEERHLLLAWAAQSVTTKP